MKKPKLIIQGLGFATAEVAYVLLVALLMQSANKLFGNSGFIVPVAILLLLVVSATVSGYLILGNPILLYFEGKKKEAVQLFGFTLGWMVAWLIVIFAFLAMFK